MLIIIIIDLNQCSSFSGKRRTHADKGKAKQWSPADAEGKEWNALSGKNFAEYIYSGKNVGTLSTIMMLCKCKNCQAEYKAEYRCFVR